MAIVEHTATVPAPPVSRQRYVRPPQPIHFPVSEEMPETNRHLELRTALYQLLKLEFAARATIGSDQFVYYDPTTARKRLAPDAFVRLGVPHAPFSSWKTWQRGAPNLGVEIVSDSDESDEAWEAKLERYRAAGIAEVVRFDPDDAERPIRVWDHIDGDLVERAPAEDGVLECITLGLTWVAAPYPPFARMLRLARDRAGRDLLPTLEEAKQAAEHERQEEARARARAEQERDRLATELLELRRRLEQQPGGAAAGGSAATGPTKSARPKPATSKSARPKPARPKPGKPGRGPR